MTILGPKSFRLLRSLAISVGVASICLCRGAVHPLEPLSAAEIKEAVGLLRSSGKIEGKVLFPDLSLKEPPKSEVLEWKPGAPFRREAFAVVLDLPQNRSFEGVIDLRSKSVLSWKELHGVQPLMTDYENTAAGEITRSNALWQAAMQRRGITNFADVALTPWAPGHLPLPNPNNARIYRVLSYFQGKAGQAYGVPIEGVEAIVDMNKSCVLSVTDFGVHPLPGVSTDYTDPAVRGTNRAALKPLQVVQPEGPSFKIEGNELSWDRWRFRFGFNQREGLVLYQVGYEDEGRLRPILYRASVADMLVPYGDTDSSWTWRNAFDEGEYGLGKNGAPLIRGQGTPAHATLLSPVLPSDRGEPVTFTNRVDIFEREGDSLWSHWDYITGTMGRRARELCIGFTATIGNYDYTYRWVFRQDASIEFRVEFNGIVLMKGVDARVCQACAGATDADENADDRFGTLIADRIVGVNHQHFVNVRLDFDVDGAGNSVKEINVESVSRLRGNKERNAFVARTKVFHSEREAARDVNPASHRMWAIFNPNTRTALDHFPSYALVPDESPFPFLGKGAAVRKPAAFLDHQFFVTRNRDGERFPAGEYPTHSEKITNLRNWVSDNEKISNEDVVIWYTFGLTHITRPEEFPIMPAAHTGFRLVPKGFFTRSPALDVPEQ